MIAVVIPSYKVKKQIGQVIEAIPAVVDRIYVIDDACPEKTGKWVSDNIKNEKVQIIYHEKNQGVGGAVITGYQAAHKDGCSIAVKVDGDGQLDPKLIPEFIKPIVDGEADYTKGNRFFYIEGLKSMPKLRLFGNSMLSIVNKLVSGYWNIMDPTNGYTAIHLSLIPQLGLNKLSKDYFFESDMLFRLNIIRAVVKDISMSAVYADEESNLSISKVLFSFPPRYLCRLFKRIFYTYFLRDFNIGTIALLSGSMSLLFGLVFGGCTWYESWLTQTQAPLGTIMISALSLMFGFQTLLFALQQDISNVPNSPIQKK